MPWQEHLDSCITQEEFKNIRANEAYRFDYLPSFCPYNTSLTIIKYEDSIVLETLVYHYAWDGKPCKVIELSSKHVDSLSWSKVQDGLEKADLWGLKQDNGRRGFDGSTLNVYGFSQGRSMAPE